MPTKPSTTTTTGSPAAAVRQEAGAAPPEVTATIAPRRVASAPGGAAESAPVAAPMAGPVAAPAAAPPQVVGAAAAAHSSVYTDDLYKRPRAVYTDRRLVPGQVVCWQLAAGLIAASAGRAWWVIVAAAIVGVALVTLTATWHRDLWLYQRALLGLGYLVRGPRFVPLEATRGTLEIGDFDAATIGRTDGITVLLEAGSPVQLSDLPTDLPAKLLVQRDRSWIAVTAPRTAGRHRDTELELLLANAVRRLVKRVPAVPLTSGELMDVLARLTPKHAHENWNGLRLWSGRYRMYATPRDLTNVPPGALTVTLSSDLDHALVLAPAGAPAVRGSVPLTGRQRSAFTAALP
jgi:hypothetical protein